MSMSAGGVLRLLVTGGGTGGHTYPALTCECGCGAAASWLAKIDYSQSDWST